MQAVLPIPNSFDQSQEQEKFSYAYFGHRIDGQVPAGVAGDPDLRLPAQLRARIPAQQAPSVPAAVPLRMLPDDDPYSV